MGKKFKQLWDSDLFSQCGCPFRGTLWKLIGYGFAEKEHINVLLFTKNSSFPVETTQGFIIYLLSSLYFKIKITRLKETPANNIKKKLQIHRVL